MKSIKFGYPSHSTVKSIGSPTQLGGLKRVMTQYVKFLLCYCEGKSWRGEYLNSCHVSFVTWLITAIGLILTAQIIPGIQIENFWIAIIAAVVMGLINAFVRPILVFYTLPLTFLTLGLFLLIVNAISFSLVGYFTPVFKLEVFWMRYSVQLFFPVLSG